MSWWNLPGREGDVIGDRPADLIRAALRRSAAGALPLPQVLGALDRALEKTRSAVEDPPPEGAHVVAVTASGEIAPQAGADDSVEALADGIREAEAAYHERFERRPRLVELLATFAFVLRSDNEGLRDLEIRPARPGG